MKFAIQNSANRDPTTEKHFTYEGCHYPVLIEKYNAISSPNTSPWEEHADIEIDTIEQLLDLVGDLGNDIIIGGEIDGLPLLLIYDGYIE